MNIHNADNKSDLHIEESEPKIFYAEVSRKPNKTQQESEQEKPEVEIVTEYEVSEPVIVEKVPKQEADEEKEDTVTTVQQEDVPIQENVNLNTNTNTNTNTNIEDGKYVVGYFASWGKDADKLDGDKLTHINYAFADIGDDMRVKMAQPNADVKNFEDLRELKRKHPHLKTLISIGGWGFSGNFSDAAATEKNRRIFAQSCVDFIVEHGFDGVDLDWEFPVSGGLSTNKNRAEDRKNFTLLLECIREKLDEQSKSDGKKYLLTIAGGVGYGYLAKIEPKRVAEIVDYIFVMGYDMHGTWDAYSDLNAPLYTPSDESPQYKLSVEESINAYIESGVDAEKLVLGMPFYGYGYMTGDGLYSKFSSAKSMSYRILKNGYIDNDSFEYNWHDDAEVPYLISDEMFISFDDEHSILEKSEYAADRGLAGVGMWELSQDYNGELL
ncbi:MAG: glycoside hydrolase family 18 protein, partial [Oscillospiraceae bacterium]|nr:glycoside hydrolase family 18 protein [Oscillospiraceae bacterium]